jgi:outer membrane biosynthesis protein TonB
VRCPDKLSRRVALLLVAPAFGLTFAIQALSHEGSSAEPAARHAAGGLVARDLQLAAAGTVPALRQPRRPRVHSPKLSVTKPAPVTPAPAVQPTPAAPTATAQPTATPTPRSAPTPAPRYVPPAPPPPSPAPTAEPPSGEFDTTGSDNSDTGGEP